MIVAPWDEMPDVLPEPGPHPLDAHEERSRLRVTLRDGRAIEGIYNLIARRHFLHCTGPGLPVMGEVEGPLLADDVATVEVVMKRFRRAVATPAYAAMVRVLRDGRRSVHPDLFAC